MGRSGLQADLVLNAAHMADTSLVSKLSSLHFTLTLNDGGTVSLVDHSMNGTWVGGRRVGKGEICSLQHFQVTFCQIITKISISVETGAESFMKI